MPVEQDGEPSKPVDVRAGLSSELKEILEFNEKENQKHRDFFEMLYKRTAGALTVIVVVVGALIAFVGWHTIGDIKKQAQDASAEEIRATREQSDRAVTEEILRIRQEVSKKLDAEFQTDQIRQTVGEAARRQTQVAMMPLISHEVTAQVSSGVRAEQNGIKSTLVSETRKALDDMKPVIDKTIEGRVSNAVDVAVKNQVDMQISPRIQQLQNSEQMSQLVTQAISGDGASYDILMRLSNDPRQDQTTRNTAYRTFAAVLQAHNSLLYSALHFNNHPSPEQKIADLGAGDALTRRAAIDELSLDYATKNLDQLFNFMTTDPDLSVREAAFVKFKSVTKADFLNLDTGTAAIWWQSHRGEFVKDKK